MDYILLPNWLTKENIIESKYLNLFFENIEIKNNRINLNILRDYYTNDKLLFQKFVDEMALRGFSFFSQKPNNILPKINFTSNLLFININNKGKNYKSINFERIGISNFVERFAVTNDLFFNNIPIEGFFYLNKNININIFKEEFENNGFRISKEYYKTNLIIGEILNTIYKEDIINTNTERVKNKETEAIKIENLNLSIRAFNALKKYDIQDANDLIKLSRKEIKKIKNIGDKTVCEIESVKNNLLGEKIESHKFNIYSTNSIKEYFKSKSITEILQNNSIFTIAHLMVLKDSNIKILNNCSKKNADVIIEKIDEFKNIYNYNKLILNSNLNLSNETFESYQNIKISNIITDIADKNLCLKDLQNNSKNLSFFLGNFYAEKTVVNIIESINNLLTPKEILNKIGLNTIININTLMYI